MIVGSAWDIILLAESQSFLWTNSSLDSSAMMDHNEWPLCTYEQICLESLALRVYQQRYPDRFPSVFHRFMTVFKTVFDRFFPFLPFFKTYIVSQRNPD
jgi:hypothetical protein